MLIKQKLLNLYHQIMNTIKNHQIFNDKLRHNSH